MRSQSITLMAALLGAATAVPCYELIWTGNMPTATELFMPLQNPFGPQPDGKHWDVVDAKDCLVRWQPIRPGQQPNDARVTKTVFEATEAQVRAAILNYNNNGNTNIQLWLPMRTKSLQYSHMLPDYLGQGTEVIIPQSSLSDSSRMIVSIILPSGKQKLQEVYMKTTGDFESDFNVKRAGEVGIHGVTGTIDKSDWAYMNGAELRQNMRAIYDEQKSAFYDRRQWKSNQFAYALAEKENGDCVVIDFRNFDEFWIRNTPVA